MPFSRLQGKKKQNKTEKKKNTVVTFYTVQKETLTKRKRKREEGANERERFHQAEPSHEDLER